ncbi:hypothetical protein JOQ06_017905, partial [Pogonophryne albipinna]
MMKRVDPGEYETQTVANTRVEISGEKHFREDKFGSTKEAFRGATPRGGEVKRSFSLSPRESQETFLSFVCHI